MGRWVIVTLTVEAFRGQFEKVGHCYADGKAFRGQFGKVGHCYTDSRSPFQSSSAVLVLQNKSSASLLGVLENTASMKLVLK